MIVNIRKLVKLLPLAIILCLAGCADKSGDAMAQNASEIAEDDAVLQENADFSTDEKELSVTMGQNFSTGEDALSTTKDSEFSTGEGGLSATKDSEFSADGDAQYITGDSEISTGEGELPAPKDYEKASGQYPECTYGSGEWMGKDGVLTIPFDFQHGALDGYDVNQITAAFTIPEDVLEKASTEDLLTVAQVFFSYPVCPSYAYETPETFMEMAANRCNAVDEILHRKDAAEIVFADYEKKFLADGENIESLKSYLALEECLLAEEGTYGACTEEQRAQIMDAVILHYYDNVDQETAWYAFSSSAFLARIKGQKETGSWYQYFEEHCTDQKVMEELKKYGEAGSIEKQDSYAASSDSPAMEAVDQVLKDDRLDLEDIKYLRSRKLLEVGYGDSGEITYLSGNFWNKKVDSVEDVEDTMKQINAFYGEDVVDRPWLLEEIRKSTNVSAELEINCLDRDEPKLMYVIYLRNSWETDSDEDFIDLDYSKVYFIAADENAGQIIRKASTYVY